METLANEIERLKERLKHEEAKFADAERQISDLAAQLRAAGIVPIFAAELQVRANSASEKQLDLLKAEPKARSSSPKGKGGRKGKGKARQNAEPQHAEPNQSDNEAVSSKASSCAPDSAQELRHSKTRWPVDERFSQTTSEKTSLDQYVGETSLSPNCTVKVCRSTNLGTRRIVVVQSFVALARIARTSM